MWSEAEAVWEGEGGVAQWWKDLADADEEIESGVWSELTEEQQAVWLLQCADPRVCAARNSFLASAFKHRSSLLARRPVVPTD